MDIAIILCVSWAVIIIGRIITDRLERKERMKQWAEFEKLFREEFAKQEAERVEPQPPAREYEPVCPRGYNDCIWDPARIQCKNPEWYKRLYGDMTPEEAVKAPTGCKDKVEKDPDEKYYCYDDEEK